MRKIKINPKYEYLRAFIESIPDIFEKEGREIYNKRNLIKVLTAPDGTLVNVKRFHINSSILGISGSQKVNGHSNIL